jgi:hypothetical protein
MKNHKETVIFTAKTPSSPRKALKQFWFKGFCLFGRSWRPSRLGGGLMFIAFCVLGGTALQAATLDSLFTVVPPTDPVYGQLRQLSEAQLLTPQESQGPLTRFDVAMDILKARDHYEGIVVADAQPMRSAGTLVTPASPRPAPAVIYKAGVILHDLEDTYRYELSQLKDSIQALGKSLDDLEAKEYGLRKRLKGMEEFPTLAIHGLGRAFGYTQQYSGDYSGVYFPNPGMRLTYGYLDLQPEATVTKEIRFTGVLRAETNFSPYAIDQEDSANNFTLTIRRVTLEFNPPWFSAILGDFEESYTPFTLWNRNNLDLKYEPEMWARQDEIAKYESFLDHEPDWPFRGMKLGTKIVWPDSGFLDHLNLSTFVNMIRSGFDDSGDYGGWYFGPNQYTDWLVGGRTSLETQKGYGVGASWQGTLDLNGLILDEPLYTNQPGTPYNPNEPSSWAHQYLIGSVSPGLKVGLGNDIYVGGMMEYAYSSYQDDKLDSARIVADYALRGGPYLQVGQSSVSLVFLNVDPFYYNPMAQTRQDAVTGLSNMAQYVSSPELWQPPLRSEYFLSDVPRPGAIYSFYDRTQDNTFPYGLATPNRQGIGLEFDVKALNQQALKVLGSAYLAQEITSELSLVPNGTVMEPVQVSPGAAAPVRNFTYINVGPSFNLGPSIGWDRALEIGSNFRYEQTTSSLGTLTSIWVIGGARVQILPFWEMTAAYSQRQANGVEYGYDGTLYARYTYLFDGSDIGDYSPVHVNGTVQSLRWSTTFRVGRNSSIYLDYDWSFGDMLPTVPLQGTLNNQVGEVTYEVKF